jgi:uncharacterized membrane protein
VILLLGVGGGSAFYKFMADRSGNLEVIVHTNKMVVLADWLFTTPSAIIQPLTGVMLINMLNISLWTPWLLASIILYAFAGILWLVAVYLQLLMKKISLDAQAQNTFLDKKYFRLVRYWIILGVFSFLAMGGVFVLMVFKP